MIATNIQQACVTLFENAPGVDLIDDDIAIFDNVNDIPSFDHPLRVEAAVFAICLDGHIRIRINMEEYRVSRNQLVLSLPGQIIQNIETSEDLSGIFVIVSKDFMEEIVLHIQDILTAFFYIKEHPVTELTAKELECMREYHAFIWDKIKKKDKPFRKEIALSLLQAMFHETCGIFKNHRPIPEVKKNRQEELFATFMQMLTLHYQQERSVSFYANKLCVTPKYLSLLVKKVSNFTVGEWIDQYVILEAKALLSSSTLSIQEITDRLNFANQSFFGKYFKRYVGISPTEYRKKW